MTSPITTKICVREFSRCGLCIVLGTITKETPKSYWILDRFDGAIRRIGKRPPLIHTEPCASCTDHRDTQYPNGYMD